VEYLDGRDVYPDLLAAGEKEENFKRCSSKFELLKHFGYWSGEGPGHVAEYVPYFLPRDEDREYVNVKKRQRPPDFDGTTPRWHADSDLVQQVEGTKPLNVKRSNEYGVRIIHAAHSDSIYRMHLNVMNDGLISNLPDDYCVEVCCTADRAGTHPHQVGKLPVQLAAICRGMADMQTLASDAVLEKDLVKAYQACLLDPLTAACAPPRKIKECFNELLEAERHLLEPYWGADLKV
jgi:alpha-galactosidase